MAPNKTSAAYIGSASAPGWSGLPAVAAEAAFIARLMPRAAASPQRLLLPAAALLLVGMAWPGDALCAPQGGSVVAGQASIQQSGSTTNINQTTARVIINWQGFSIGSGETVNFNQPSVSSVALNRVIGNEKSVISGALNANGQVFIVNSNGVLFTKGAQVNVGGLVASTLNISNADFMAGNYTFSGTSQASVINKGHLRANPGGSVSLLGQTVSNDGVIVANLGTIAMASGEKITLNFGGNSLVDVTIDKGALNALVQNKRAIIANGGRVIMTAKAADQVLSAQVNNSGIIQARTMAALKGGSNGGGGRVHIGPLKIVSAGHGSRFAKVHYASRRTTPPAASVTYATGSILLLADGGTVNVSGTLDASAPKGGNGGTIETSGNSVKIADGAVITTKAASGSNGTWTIDPDGFTIATALAPVYGDITGAQLSDLLANTNITILSTQGAGNYTGDGNINVNDTVSWSSANTLTLTATNIINIGTTLTDSQGNVVTVVGGFNAPSGGVVLNAGTDINVIAPSSLHVASLNATAIGSVNIDAAQTWTTPGSWSFTGNYVNVNSPLTWYSASTLTLNATRAVNINSSTANTSIATDSDPSVQIAASNVNGTFNAPSGTLVLNAGTDIDVNNASSLQVATLNATAGGSLNFNAAQNWATSGVRNFTADNANINSPISWTSGTLNLNVANDLTIAAPLTAPANTALTLAAGKDIDILGSINWTPSKSLTLSAGNDVNIDGSVGWSANAPLTLIASNNIDINGTLSGSTGTLALNAANDVYVGGTVTATGSANFTANYGHVLDANGNPTATVSGTGLNADGTSLGLYSTITAAGAYGQINVSGNGKVTLNGTHYAVINSVTALDAVASNLSGNYVLGSNLSNIGTSDLQPFTTNQFTGGFNGFGHSLTFTPAPTLTIDAPISAGSPLPNVNLVYKSAGDIDVDAPITVTSGLVTWQAAGNININPNAAITTASNAAVTLSAGGSLNASSALTWSAGTTGTLSLFATKNVTVAAPVTWSSEHGTLNLTAGGDVDIDAAISASGANAALTLNAGGNINIAAPITLTGLSAAMAMIYGGDYSITTPGTATPTSITLSGLNASLAIDGQPYTLIHTMDQLAAITPPLLDSNGNQVVDPYASNATVRTYIYYPATGHYAIAQDIDASNSLYSGPVVQTLAGTLAGFGHTINNLTIDATTAPSGGFTNNAALIDTATASAVIRDLTLANVDIASGTSGAAALVISNNGTISNVSVSGTISGQDVGGIASGNNGSITNANADLTISCVQQCGGIVGFNFSQGTITGAHVTGSVTSLGQTFSDGGLEGSNAVGGLAGVNAGTITNSVSRANVTSTDTTDVGGLVGYNFSGGTITGSSSYGNVQVTATNIYAYDGEVGTGIGGLVGVNSGGFINSSSAYGNVTTTATRDTAITSVGGLVGLNEPGVGAGTGGRITDSNAYGNVNGVGNVGGVGGFVGTNFGTITTSNAYGNVSGAGGVGGFVGGNSNGTIILSTASGNVTGSSGVGGFAGGNGAGGVLSHDSVGASNVVGQTDVGGFVGSNGDAQANSNLNASTLNTISSNANVSGQTNVGGLIGNNQATSAIQGNNSFSGSVTVTNSFFASNVGIVIGLNNPGATIAGAITYNSTSSQFVNAIGGSGPGVASTTPSNVQGTNQIVPTDQGPDVNGTSIGSQGVSAAPSGAQNGSGTTETAATAAVSSAAASDDDLRSAKPPNPAQLSAAGTRATATLAPPSIEDTVTIQLPEPPPVEQQPPRPRHAAVTAPRKPSIRRGNFGAAIRSIEINGEHFDLESKPGSGGQQHE